MIEARKAERANPLDAVMTKAQVVRRRFKSALPRKPENRVLTKLEAMGRTMELFDKLRAEMHAAGLSEDDVFAGLVFCQPDVPGKENVAAEMYVIRDPNLETPVSEQIQAFVQKVMTLDRPLFLGVMFLQIDRDTQKAEQKNVAFVWPFMGGPEAEKRLIGIRNQQAKGGFKTIAN